MANVLAGKSNGEEKDRAWGWKHTDFQGIANKKVAERPHELRSYEDGNASRQKSAKL